MSVLGAVQTVLEQAHTPLHYRELTRRVLEGHLWHTTGKTPADTVSAQLAVDIIRRGSASRFQRTAEGVFALRAWGQPEYVRPVSTKTTPKSATPGKQQAPGPPALTPLKADVAQPEMLSFTDAAEHVLEHVANKKPMHYRDITQHALRLGLVKTSGRTPEATLYS